MKKKQEENNNKIYHNVGTFQKFNRTMVERGQFETPNTQIHDL